MAIRVQIPGPLRPLTGGAAELEVEASDVAGLVEALDARHRGMRERLVDASGELRSYVRVFVEDRDVRTLQGKDTALAPGVTVAIVPAIAGGGEGAAVDRAKALCSKPLTGLSALA
jgi:molybdopterin synthase sulfur carrier subunit